MNEEDDGYLFVVAIPGLVGVVWTVFVVGSLFAVSKDHTNLPTILTIHDWFFWLILASIVYGGIRYRYPTFFAELRRLIGSGFADVTTSPPRPTFSEGDAMRSTKPAPESEPPSTGKLERVPQNSPLPGLLQELEEIMARDDRPLLFQRLTAIRRSMDANTYEKNVASWLRKFNAGVEVLEAMNKAQRAQTEHEQMPLERQKREAELKADIEHHRAREAEAKMRQRMAQEE